MQAQGYLVLFLSFLIETYSFASEKGASLIEPFPHTLQEQKPIVESPMQNAKAKTHRELLDFENCRDILFVDPQKGSDTHSGETWARAVKSLEFAVHKAEDKQIDCIWVKKGVISVAKSLHISSNLKMFGGFLGRERRVSERSFSSFQPEKLSKHTTTEHFTVLNGNGHVCQIISLGGSATEVGLDGFEIEGGLCEPRKWALDYSSWFGTKAHGVLGPYIPKQETLVKMAENMQAGFGYGQSLRFLGKNHFTQIEGKGKAAKAMYAYSLAASLNTVLSLRKTNDVEAWAAENIEIRDDIPWMKGKEQTLEQYIENSFQELPENDETRIMLGRLLGEKDSDNIFKIAVQLYEGTYHTKPTEEIMKDIRENVAFFLGLAVGITRDVNYLALAKGAASAVITPFAAKAVLGTAIVLFSVDHFYGYLEASWGGGLYVWANTDLWIRNSYFHDNRAGYGGALFLGVGANNNVQIDHSYFKNNEAISIQSPWLKSLPGINYALPLNWAYGGAIYKRNGDLVIYETQFHENSIDHDAVGGGGALYSDWGHTLILQSEFIANKAYTGGAVSVLDTGIFSLSTSKLTDMYLDIRSSAFYENVSEYGSSLYSMYGKVLVKDSIFFSDAESGYQMYLHNGLSMDRSIMGGTPNRSLTWRNMFSGHLHVNNSCLDGKYSLDEFSKGNKTQTGSIHFMKAGEFDYQLMGDCKPARD